ncbi:MAG TPA: myo-inosose-2 dehydratase [Caulobacteraceae bacterium]|nr:myo-inosose-2 dehydratase [Caulobacteraceae bacterium]
MSIRFGVSPIAWVNDDMPELGADTPVETILRDAAEIGFEGVELGGKFPRDPAVLRALLDSYGLALVGGWYSSSLLTRGAADEIAALQPHLALLKALGSDVFVVAETSNAIHGDKGRAMTATPQLDPADWAAFGRGLSEVAAYIEDEGLKFAYHHHLGTVVERKQDLDRFVEATSDKVGLTLDTGHAALGGVDALAVIRDHPGRVRHVHCKDVRGEVHRHQRAGARSFLEGVLAGMFTVPDDGDLDFGAVMKALKAIDYAGWIVVEAEQDPAIADPRVYGQRGLDGLKREARRAGLI